MILARTGEAEGWDPVRVRLDATTHAPCIDHDPNTNKLNARNDTVSLGP